MPESYTHWPVNLLVVATTAATVALVVLLHYEALVWLNGRLARQGAHQRRKVLMGMYVLLGVHITEIWIFGIVLRLLLQVSGAGHVVGMDAPDLMDSVYLSATTYSTVGFGDLAPVGAIRFLTGTEALTGFMLITWSASFTYLEMEKFWRSR
jgi:hypothetical protein